MKTINLIPNEKYMQLVNVRLDQLITGKKFVSAARVLAKAAEHVKDDKTFYNKIETKARGLSNRVSSHLPQATDQTLIYLLAVGLLADNLAYKYCTNDIRRSTYPASGLSYLSQLVQIEYKDRGVLMALKFEPVFNEICSVVAESV